MLESRTLTLTATLQPQGRLKLFSILQMSGLLTVGDALSSTDIKTLFDLTENQNYAGIIPVEQFLSADLQDYAADPTIPEERLKQAMSSEEFLSAFHHLLDNSQLPAIVAFLKGDLGRALLQQKLWPVQFLTIEKESLQQLADGTEKVQLTLKVYSKKG
jgi:hypothetical protein